MTVKELKAALKEVPDDYIAIIDNYPHSPLNPYDTKIQCPTTKPGQESGYLILKGK